jgi:hypothetical protein
MYGRPVKRTPELGVWNTIALSWVLFEKNLHVSRKLLGPEFL